jgi:hypothetical protein
MSSQCQGLTVQERTAAAYLLADRMVVSDVESYGVRAKHLPGRVYDVRPMTDLREHPEPEVDIATIALAYGCSRGLLQPEAAHPGHVRIVRDTR